LAWLRTLAASAVVGQVGCASLKPLQPKPRRDPVIGIYSILIFLAVIAALNFYEFGRFD
jgi:hypothetical protein